MISLSPHFLGVMHPHLHCQLDNATALLRFTKTPAEAVFCLNLFANIVYQNKCWNNGDFGGMTGVGCPLQTLAISVEQMAGRFPATVLTATENPLSPKAVLFALSLGCRNFSMDWIVAAPFNSVQQVILALTLHDHSTASVDSEFGGEIGATTTSSSRESDVNDNNFALANILATVIHCWGKELGKGSDPKLDWGNRGPTQLLDATVSRLAAVLLLAPNAFIYMALKPVSSVRAIIDNEDNRHGTGIDLPTAITKTLHNLSNRPLSVASGCWEGKRRAWSICIAQVLDLGQSFLQVQFAILHSTSSPEEVGVCSRFPSLLKKDFLAQACCRLTNRVFALPVSEEERDTIYAPLFNLLTSLIGLVFLVGRMRTVNDGGEKCEDTECAMLLAEAWITIAESRVSSGTYLAQALLTWKPKAFAAYLQLCALSHTVGLLDDKTAPHAECLLHPPAEILEEILLTTDSPQVQGECEGDGDICQTSAQIPLAMLQAQAARCVACVARLRPFSHWQVQSLQLALQGVASNYGERVIGMDTAIAALQGMQALWEAYKDEICWTNLQGQPWHPFVLECCAEKASWMIAGSIGSDLERHRHHAVLLLLSSVVCFAEGQVHGSLSPSIQGCRIRITESAENSLIDCLSVITSQVSTRNHNKYQVEENNVNCVANHNGVVMGDREEQLHWEVLTKLANLLAQQVPHNNSKITRRIFDTFSKAKNAAETTLQLWSTMEENWVPGAEWESLFQCNSGILFVTSQGWNDFFCCESTQTAKTIQQLAAQTLRICSSFSEVETGDGILEPELVSQ